MGPPRNDILEGDVWRVPPKKKKEQKTLPPETAQNISVPLLYRYPSLAGCSCVENSASPVRENHGRTRADFKCWHKSCTPARVPGFCKKFGVPSCPSQKNHGLVTLIKPMEPWTKALHILREHAQAAVDGATTRAPRGVHHLMGQRNPGATSKFAEKACHIPTPCGFLLGKAQHVVVFSVFLRWLALRKCGRGAKLGRFAFVPTGSM